MKTLSPALPASGIEPKTSRSAVPNRVPAITPEFWMIKLLAVTMGETAADYLAVNLGYGLATTSIVMSVLLVFALAIQFLQRRYVPWSYWLAVVMVSIVGTLVTDNLVDNLGVSLASCTIAFSGLLALVFVVWYGFEGTLSIHSVITGRREAFYWLAILLTFALGTAVGDLVAETMELGYLTTGLLFAVVIGLIVVAYLFMGMGAVLAFWLAYIFTRPLGASFGDLLSQPVEYGGLGFGTIATSLLFLGLIVALVAWLTLLGRGREDVDPRAGS